MVQDHHSAIFWLQESKQLCAKDGVEQLEAEAFTQMN